MLGQQDYVTRVSPGAFRLAAGLCCQVNAQPAPLMGWAGCKDPCVIRGIFEVIHWLESLPGSALTGTAAISTSDLFLSEVGGEAAVTVLLLFLCSSFTLFAK
jgi:hypothetical protein